MAKRKETTRREALLGCALRMAGVIIQKNYAIRCEAMEVNVAELAPYAEMLERGELLIVALSRARRCTQLRHAIDAATRWMIAESSARIVIDDRHAVRHARHQRRLPKRSVDRSCS